MLNTRDETLSRGAGIVMVIMFLLTGFLAATRVEAQDDPLVIATVTRPPFSMSMGDAGHDGFAIVLFEAIAADLGREVRFDRRESFSEMLAAVENGEVDGAIANISMTSEREARMDFSQPIYRSGLRIMTPYADGGVSITGTLFTRQIALVIVGSFAALFVAGMFMWLFERRRQPYFDRPMRSAMFPSFWWALNLVVNGGFEERMPQSAIGRVFSVIMIISSLFVVSIFVAHITAATTVQALNGSIDSLSDLEGRRIGTIESATAADFLQERDFRFQTYPGLEELLAAFEDETLDAVVFDSPILAYYVQNDGLGVGQLLDRLYRPENYGIALPSDSPLRDDINQALLRLRENGTYDVLYSAWFGGNS